MNLLNIYDGALVFYYRTFTVKSFKNTKITCTSLQLQFPSLSELFVSRKSNDTR